LKIYYLTIIIKEISSLSIQLDFYAKFQTLNKPNFVDGSFSMNNSRFIKFNRDVQKLNNLNTPSL
jgi:hypothetical protein